MLEDEERLSVLWFDFTFEQLLNCILIKTFPRQSKEIRSMVNKFSINQKAKLLYALKLINETTLKDIKLIRDIRNEFFHGMPSKGFTNAKICSLFGKLSTANGQKVTESNSYGIYFKAVLKHVKRLALIISDSQPYKIPMPGKALIVKPKVKSKRKSSIKSQQSKY